MYCSQCGTQNNDTAKFCKKCGNMLSSDSMKKEVYVQKVEDTSSTGFQTTREETRAISLGNMRGVFKGAIIVMLLIGAISIFIGVIGIKSFTCGYCMRSVKEKPHDVKMLGQQIEICDDCYDMLRDYQQQWN